MKKLTALAGVLLLSSSLITACGPEVDRGASPDNRTETYDTTRGGRVMDTRDNHYTDTRTGRDAAYRYGVNRYQPRATPAGDRDRLGVRDDIGPDRLGPGILGGGAGLGLGARDQDRLGVRDNIGPDRSPFMRADRTLESRVEALPGVRNAAVAVSGNTAYVAVDRGGTDATRNNTYTNDVRNNMTGMGGGTNDTSLTDDLRSRVTNAVKAANPTITNVYVSANPAVMNRMESYLRGAGTGAARGLNDIGDLFTRPFVGATGTGTTAGNTAGTGTGIAR